MKDRISTHNEQMAEKFAQVAKQLSSAQDPWKVMENYLSLMETVFHIPYVWLSLTDTKDNEGIIRKAAGISFLSERLNIIPPEVFHRLVGRETKPLMLNGDLRPYLPLQPQKVKFFVKSLCIAPLRLEDLTWGSLNHGDHTPHRWCPKMNTSLLRSLTEKVSCSYGLLGGKTAASPAPE